MGLVKSKEEIQAHLGQQELLEKVALGDRDAFSALYDQVSSKIHALSVRVLKDVSQAEEVTQEVFLEIWENAPKYNPNKGTAITWMMTIAHRRSVDRVRSAQSSHNRDIKIGIQNFTEAYDDVEDSVQISMESEKVINALNRLTEFQRNAIVLAYYEGYTHKEVSERLNIPLGTVKTRLRDGMIRLRDELGVAQ
jgi:RNA polymerase sigma-70 factor (ECF subfamily)